MAFKNFMLQIFCCVLFKPKFYHYDIYILKVKVVQYVGQFHIFRDPEFYGPILFLITNGLVYMDLQFYNKGKSVMKVIILSCLIH